MWCVWVNRSGSLKESRSQQMQQEREPSRRYSALVDEMQQRPPTPPTVSSTGNRHPDHVEINVYVSIGQHSASAAAVCRCSQAKVVMVATAPVSTADPELAKANAVRLVLKLAADLRGSDCIVVSDAKSLVHWICNKDSTPRWQAAHIIYECRNILQANTRVRLVW